MHVQEGDKEKEKTGAVARGPKDPDVKDKDKHTVPHEEFPPLPAKNEKSNSCRCTSNSNNNQGAQGASTIQQNQAIVTRVMDPNGKDFTTFLHKKGTPQSLPLEDYRREQIHQQPRGPPPGDRQDQQHRRQLRGVKREKGITMYLSGIEVEDETDDEVVRIVKDHARDKGIRIIGHNVIRTRRFPYVVGCKIILPDAQEYRALTPDTWPSDVLCRKWDPQPRRKWNPNGGWGKDNNQKEDWDYDQNNDYNNNW